jgi:NAD(P)-dependent dehydrogenase (short-subunit alcohol dehydrogenase family)
VKTIVIGGAASGIGKAITLTLAKEDGVALELVDIDEAGLAATIAEAGADKCTATVANLADIESIEAAFSAIGNRCEAIDELYNCAGIPAGTPAWPDTPPARIKAIVDLNLLGTIMSVKCALPLMRRPGGSIVNLASVSGLNPYLTGAIYAASKAGVIMFTRSCADLAASEGVRVNALCPGAVNTPFLQKTGMGGAMADWLRDKLASGELLQAQEVADVAIELARRPDLAGHFETLLAKGGPASA